MQKVIFDTKCKKQFKDFVEKNKIKKLFIVCTNSFMKMKEFEEITSCAEQYVVFNCFSPNPKYEEVCSGVKLFRDNDCDSVFAAGGGSALDTAKCIKLFSGMNEEKCYLEQEYAENNVKFLAFPTTAGTGSESTRFAVIYKDGAKQSVTSDYILPDVAVLNCEVLKTLPVYLKKCTLLDAWCQAIESYWSVYSDDESKKLSQNAIELIDLHAKDYLYNEEAYEEIMKASNYAGRAINITRTTAAHAMSYKITTMFDIPHGRAVAMCLPSLWEFMYYNTHKCVDKRGSEYLKGIFKEIAGFMGCENTLEGINKAKEFVKSMNFEKPVVTDDSIYEILSESVNTERLQNNPVKLENDDLKKIYKEVL